MPRLNVAFVVQGEGRGHMTQALALAAYLRGAGHEVVRVLLGRSPHRAVPDYFVEEIAAPVVLFDAPAQVPGPDRRGLSPFRTVVDALRRAPEFRRSLACIERETRGVDLVVNFLDLLGGIARYRVASGPPSLAVAHNYLFLHGDLSHAPGPGPVRQAVLGYARVTAWGTRSKLALSFRPMAPDRAESLRVMPPLLRPGLADLPAGDDGSLLAYALNPGYALELLRWQGRAPGTPVHCFVEGGEAALGGERAGSGFHIHDLDGAAFLARLATCRAYVGSAGFESLCEAHYLGKPVLAVPTAGQFEQTLNAWDAERCGVAVAGTYADLDAFWRDAEPPEAAAVRSFRDWVSRGPDMFVQSMEEAAGRP